MMEELGTIQDLLTVHDFYIIDSKVEEVGRALGLTDIGLDKDVTDLSGGRGPRSYWGNCFWRNRISCFWMSPPIIWTRCTLNG